MKYDQDDCKNKEMCSKCQEMKCIQTCNTCGFDYCQDCNLNVEMHQPCDKNKESKEEYKEELICHLCKVIFIPNPTLNYQSEK